MLFMETLGRLFGNENKVKIMKLFLFNQNSLFSTHEVADRVKADVGKVRRELNGLEKMGLVKKRGGNRRGGQGFILDRDFTYLNSLQNFLLNVEPLHPKEIIKKVSKLGSIKLILISGLFIQDPESRVDLLIVGDGVKKANLENTIKMLESEIGKELRYAYFSTDDFKYRLSMFDKLTRDILDYPHKKVLNKLGIA